MRACVLDMQSGPRMETLSKPRRDALAQACALGQMNLQNGWHKFQVRLVAFPPGRGMGGESAARVENKQGRYHFIHAPSFGDSGSSCILYMLPH